MWVSDRLLKAADLDVTRATLRVALELGSWRVKVAGATWRYRPLTLSEADGPRPRLLGLFCGAGGAAVGYRRAGFDVVGVDIAPQPHYPFEFHQADALTWPLDGFDAIHASPPCQAYSWSARRWHDVERVDLVEPTRDRLRSVAVPFVIENVIGAPLHQPFTLCGRMFGLPLIRHRRFESSALLWPLPGHPRHVGLVGRGEAVTVAGHGGDNIRGHGSRADKQRAMGIDWMSDVELNEAIPPAYTEWIGAQLLRALAVAA
jgi:DNA (cytosine-5)-methyltransferase 1